MAVRWARVRRLGLASGVGFTCDLADGIFASDCWMQW
jgi:hypothetical protein